jgi:hypothetical protein
MKANFLTLLVASAGVVGCAAQTNAGWRYTLLDASSIADDCPICGRPTVWHPLRGTFDLVLVDSNPLFAEYRLTNISFFAQSKAQPLYTVTGHGTYREGGEVALRQEVVLQTEVCNLTPSCRDVTFTNENMVPATAFPLIDVSVTQTQASLFSVYSMRIVVAPVREIWFGVTNGFIATNAPTEVHTGDLLSHTGRLVRTNTMLLQSVGITNPSPTLRVDSFDIAPGGEIVFSLSDSAGSSTLGAIAEGDLLSNRGRIVQRNQQLTARFGIQPPVPDIGLDAVFVMASGEVLFSIRTNVFAEAQGMGLRHGDVLSNTGTLVKDNQQLLARFHPPESFAAMDYGLDAFHVWPNGEIWFSLETGFDDALLGAISDGDLLSSEGIIVFRNEELVSAFAAPQNTAGFGLSDVFVVSDAVVASPPRFLSPRIESGGVNLQWIGTNRVFQLERASDVRDPWQPIGEIDPNWSFHDAGLAPRSFYRLRAW